MFNNNSVLSYGIYMMNTWCENEAHTVFGEVMGDHLWSKYTQYYKDYGTFGAPMKFMFELDSENYLLLVTRACELYDGRKNR